MIQIRFVWPKPTQVLIYGELGETFLRKVVPSSYAIEVLPIREGLPITIRYSFFRRCLINYIRQNLSLRQAYFSALIDEFKPRAVITFVDNNDVLGAYAELRPNVLVISIQNAVRTEVTIGKQIGRAPLYFSLGEITKEKVQILQEVDYIFISSLKEEGLYDSVWQAGAMFLPVQSVGVMGDERTYENTVALRAVESTDGMTADWVHLPYEFLSKVSNEIINKVKGINRVVYDISSKPPATIEWE